MALHRILGGSRLREPRLPPGAEGHRVGTGLSPLLRAGCLHRHRQGTQLQPQRRASLPGLQLVLVGMGRRQPDPRLDAVPGLVHEQDRAGHRVFRQRQHQHGPGAPVPAHGGIGDRHAVGQAAAEHRAVAFQGAIGPVHAGNELAAGRIDQQHRPAQAHAPGLAVIGRAQLLHALEDRTRHRCIRQRLRERHRWQRQQQQADAAAEAAGPGPHRRAPRMPAHGAPKCPSGAPASRCRWIWNTVCPAFSRQFITMR